MEVSERLQHITNELDALLSVGFAHDDVAGAAELIRGVEAAGRRMDAARDAVLAAIDASHVHRDDGHRTAKAMVRHVAQLSGAEATRRAQSAAMMRDLPDVAAAFRAGEIGTCQVARLGRLHANRRVRALLADAADIFVEWAKTLSYKAFDEAIGCWETLADADGAGDRHRRRHEARDTILHHDYDGGWSLFGRFGSLDGARLDDIFERFVHAEWEADWAEARARLGDAATVSDLARTDAQRRADALLAVFERAATVVPGEAGGRFVTNIVLDHETFQRQTAALAGVELPPRDPADSTFRCETLDGHPLDPAQVTLMALWDDVRRVVVGADGVVIDMGRRRRFVRAAALAARLTANECMWPGCHAPVTSCEIDHLRPWADGGDTDQTNAAPLCGGHNLAKQNQRWRTWRDPDGTWHLTRPDGTTVHGPRPPAAPARGSPPRGSPHDRAGPDAVADPDDRPDASGLAAG